MGDLKQLLGASLVWIAGAGFCGSGAFAQSAAPSQKILCTVLMQNGAIARGPNKSTCSTLKTMAGVRKYWDGDQTKAAETMRGTKQPRDEEN